MEDEERFARGADRAVTNRERSLKETGQSLEDVATGKVSVTTIKDEVSEKTTSSRRQ
jgi:DNA-directed RNA polymerase subunit K/omega